MKNSLSSVNSYGTAPETWQIWYMNYEFIIVNDKKSPNSVDVRHFFDLAHWIVHIYWHKSEFELCPSPTDYTLEMEVATIKGKFHAQKLKCM